MTISRDEILEILAKGGSVTLEGRSITEPKDVPSQEYLDAINLKGKLEIHPVKMVPSITVNTASNTRTAPTRAVNSTEGLKETKPVEPKVVNKDFNINLTLPSVGKGFWLCVLGFILLFLLSIFCLFYFVDKDVTIINEVKTEPQTQTVNTVSETKPVENVIRERVIKIFPQRGNYSERKDSAKVEKKENVEDLEMRRQPKVLTANFPLASRSNTHRVTFKYIKKFTRPYDAKVELISGSRHIPIELIDLQKEQDRSVVTFKCTTVCEGKLVLTIQPQ